jgi:hypothetical protein
MNKTNIASYFIISILVLSSSSLIPNNAFAASQIDLGTTNTFGVLSNTYTDTSSSTITGDLGYTTLTGTPVVSGHTRISTDAQYTQAGTDLNTAISQANGLGCTVTPGSPSDLSSAVPSGIYAPGVYCISGATTTGAGITLTGNGDHIFRIAGSLNSVASTFIHLTGGALADTVYWVPTGATTLGATSNFTGNILTVSDVTIGTTVTMTGRVLAFGHTVTTTFDTITVPSSVATPIIDIASPTSGQVGQSVAVDFNNLLANHAYTIQFGSTTASGPFASGTTNSTGGAAGSVTVPIGITLGSQPLTATDGTSSPSTPFTVTAPAPIIDVASPTSGQVGQSVAVNFNNLIANHAYTIQFGSTTASSGFASGTTNSSGGAAGSVTVPIGITIGSQPLTATDGTNSPSTPFTVNALTISLGTASSYTVLSGSVITNGVTGQPTTGDTGHISTLSHSFTYTGLPLGSDHFGIGPLGDTATLGTPLGDEHAALGVIGLYTGSSGNNTGLACDFTFAPGAIDLAIDTTHGHIGRYLPGVYCIKGAASIGTAGINLNASGTYVFKIDGALTSVDGSHVTLSGGALASNVFWASTGAASLGANTSFQGTILSGPAAITLGANSNLDQGRLISESAITIKGGTHNITVPGGVTLSSIAITHAANQLSYTVGDPLDITGLQVTGTFSDTSTHVVTPTNVTGFNSASPVFGEVLTVHVGASTATYTINVFDASSTISLGTASNYTILSGSDITNGVTGQPITGNTGHISTLTHPFTYVGLPLGSDHFGIGPLGDTATLGTPLGDEHAALGVIGTYIGTTDVGLACDTILPSGVDLATDTTHGHIGQYAPGVYCIPGAASIGTAGINLNASGTYVFKINGALTSATGSRVTLSGGALASNVFWASTGAASLGANTSFQGTILTGSAAITLGANSTLNHGRLISESEITIEGGTHIITVPGGVALSSITITHPANKLSYNAGDLLDITGLQVTGTFSDVSTSVVTPTNVTGFDSSHAAVNQILTVHVGASTTTYTITVAGAPSTINLGTASSYAILSGNSAGVITNGANPQAIASGNVGDTGGTTPANSFTFALGFSEVTSPIILGTTTTLGTPIGDAHAALGVIGSYIGTTNIGLACTYTHQGTIDLATDITHGHVGQWAPGVYCINGAITDATPGATVNLNGTGLYVFKSTGQLTTVANDFINFTGAVGGSNANAGNVFFAPIGGASLGANNQFSGTILAGSSSIILGADMNATNARFVSESAITVGGGANIFSSPIVPDTTSPTISISLPPDGTVVNQNHFAISGTASDDTSVDHVTVTVDGTPVTVAGTTIWSTDSGAQVNGTYTIVATAFDAAGNSASKTVHVTVNTIPLNSPSTSIVSATSAGSIASVTDAGHFTSFTPVSESSLSTTGKPAGETFPFGFLSFNISGLTPGQTIHVTQTYPIPIPANAKYWKVEGGVWTDATSLISISGNTLTLTITDGGFGDADGLANGQITDPSGLGVLPPVTLGTASTFGVLASTYTNTVAGVIINGDLGYTTGPAVSPIIFGTLYVAPNTVYSQAGTDQGSALVALNALPCDVTFGGITNLSLLPQPLVPGVYCVTSAMSVGTGGITLDGAGTYVFRSAGALDTAVNSHVMLTGGATAFNVFWTPGAATTLGANSVFVGTDIDDSGITIGSTVTMTGRALAFGGTVTSDTDTVTVPTAPLAPLQFNMPSGSNSPSESRPSLGGVLLQTFDDGLRINGHVFDISKFNNPVPQQVLPLDKPVTITIKQTMTRGSQTWQHAMLFMNFNGKDTTTGNADTWISIDKNDGVQVHDPNGFVTNVAINNEFAAYGMNTTFTFTPVKQMSDSNMIIRVWDNRLSQTDANVNGALVFGTAPVIAAPMVKPDWIQVFTSVTDADNVIENAGFVKPVLFSHIATTSQVWAQPNTGHILWFYDTKDLQVARVIYDASGNVVGETVEPLINSTNTIMGKDTSYAGNHLSRENSDAMAKALAQQESNAQQTIDTLGYR